MTKFNGNRFEKDESQHIIDLMEKIESQGFKGGVVLSADGQKTKNLSVTVAQAKKIQDILVAGDTPATDTASSFECLNLVVSKEAFNDLIDNYDVSMRSNKRDEAFLDTRGIPESELKNISEMLGIPELGERIMMVSYDSQKVCDWAVTDEYGEYVLETDDFKAVKERADEINEQAKEAGLDGRAAIMQKNSEGTGYTLFD